MKSIDPCKKCGAEPEIVVYKERRDNHFVIVSVTATCPNGCFTTNAVSGESAIDKWNAIKYGSELIFYQRMEIMFGAVRDRIDEIYNELVDLEDDLRLRLSDSMYDRGEPEYYLQAVDKNARAVRMLVIERNALMDAINTIDPGTKGRYIVDVVVNTGLAISRAEARRKIEQHAILLDGRKVESVFEFVYADSLHNVKTRLEEVTFTITDGEIVIQEKLTRTSDDWLSIEAPAQADVDTSVYLSGMPE